LSIEQGTPLVATLGDTSNGLQSEIENELLGRRLRTATPMVLGTGIAIALINIGQISPAVYFVITTKRIPRFLHQLLAASCLRIVFGLLMNWLPLTSCSSFAPSMRSKVGPVATHVARFAGIRARVPGQHDAVIGAPFLVDGFGKTRRSVSQSPAYRFRIFLT